VVLVAAGALPLSRAGDALRELGPALVFLAALLLVWAASAPGLATIPPPPRPGTPPPPR
jgi:hypothetical protein